MNEKFAPIYRQRFTLDFHRFESGLGERQLNGCLKIIVVLMDDDNLPSETLSAWFMPSKETRKHAQERVARIILDNLALLRTCTAMNTRKEHIP